MYPIRRLSYLALFFLLITPFLSCDSETKKIVVDSVEAFQHAQSQAQAGEILYWKDGEYADIRIDISVNGLVVETETPGGVTFTNDSRIVLTGGNITLSGFQLKNVSHTDNIIEVENNYNTVEHINVIDCLGKYYLNVNGQHNTISHCNFERKIIVPGDAEGSSIVQVQSPPEWVGYNTISHCSFKHFTTPIEGERDYGSEALRIGYSYQAQNISRTIVEYNYFYQCKGDAEIISNKAHQNVFRYNTFQNNDWAQLTLRHGGQCVIYSNFFLGSTGIRIKEGQQYAIYNNYFHTPGYYPIRLMNYQKDPLDSIVIANNTFAECGTLLLEGTGEYPPQGITLANNLFYQAEGTLFDDPSGSEIWLNNIAWGKLGMEMPDGIMQIDPELSLNSEGFYYLTASSPAIDQGAKVPIAVYDVPVLEDDPHITLDLMQVSRPESDELKDIGCSEYNASKPVKPYVDARNTGPSYLSDR